MPESNGQSRGGVLVVDDNQRLATTVATYLEMEGFTAVAAFSAEDALEAALGPGLDVAVVDINMPGIDGIEVCRRLVHAIPGVRVLMLTGREADDDEAKALAAGAVRLLLKPISLADLRDEILAVLPA
jgi:DNA-binding response OmpR family regulator